jgi:hypothetical protein
MKAGVRLLLVFALLVSACGSEPPDPPGSSAIFPIAVGNRWEFTVVDNSGGAPTTKVQTVTSTAPDGAFRFETVRGDRTTVSIQKIDAEGRLVRLSEYSTKIGVVVERVSFVPFDIRVDTDEIHFGDTYAQTFLEDHDPSDGYSDVQKTQTFTVEAVDEAVTVPAGTFFAVRIRRETTGGSAKTYWFAKDVGKIKEVGGQTEELVSADVAELGGVAP